jgi:hypothetical protein
MGRHPRNIVGTTYIFGSGSSGVEWWSETDSLRELVEAREFARARQVSGGNNGFIGWRVLSPEDMAELRARWPSVRVAYWACPGRARAPCPGAQIPLEEGRRALALGVTSVREAREQTAAGGSGS